MGTIKEDFGHAENRGGEKIGLILSDGIAPIPSSLHLDWIERLGVLSHELMNYQKDYAELGKASLWHSSLCVLLSCPPVILRSFLCAIFPLSIAIANLHLAGAHFDGPFLHDTLRQVG
jgi:hypothetical protein